MSKRKDLCPKCGLTCEHYLDEIARLHSDLASANREWKKVYSAHVTAEEEVKRLRSAIQAALDEAGSCEGTMTGMVHILAKTKRGEGER